MTSPPDEPSTLAAFLADSDARCPRCRYALRGGTSDRCPECGTELVLSLLTPGRVTAWWLMAVIGTTIGGLIALLHFYRAQDRVTGLINRPDMVRLVNAGYMSPSELPNWSGIILTSALVILSTILIAFLWTSRRRMSRLPVRGQVAVGVIGAAMPLIMIGLIRIALHWA